MPLAKIWERINLDSAGPFPASRRGNRYLLIAVDSYSKWVEAKPVNKLDAEEWCYFLMEIISRHGVPRMVRTDRAGKEFVNTEFARLCDEMSIIHSTTTGYHPEGNGLAESQVKILTHSMQRQVKDTPSKWEDGLPLLLLSLRTSVSSTTSYTPFFLNHGYEACLPCDRRRLRKAELIAKGNQKDEEPIIAMNEQIRPDGTVKSKDPHLKLEPTQEEIIDLTHSQSPNPTPIPGLQNAASSVERFVQDRDQQLAAVADRYTTQVRKAQAKQTRDFKKRHHSTEPADLMPVGSLVLIKSPANYRSKLDQHKSIEGPYRVVSWDSRKVNCVIEDGAGKRWPCHCGRVTPYTNEPQKKVSRDVVISDRPGNE